MFLCLLRVPVFLLVLLAAHRADAFLSCYLVRVLFVCLYSCSCAVHACRFACRFIRSVISCRRSSILLSRSYLAFVLMFLFVSLSFFSSLLAVISCRHVYRLIMFCFRVSFLISCLLKCSPRLTHHALRFARSHHHAHIRVRVFACSRTYLMPIIMSPILPLYSYRPLITLITHTKTRQTRRKRNHDDYAHRQTRR